mmetsp:Transcript_84032/g.238376  ORF Transcript_84032/g.238376 Transcript_84032/m.238376 type:complete len:612 (-) Transcript_84032:109-1944(-)
MQWRPYVQCDDETEPPGLAGAARGCPEGAGDRSEAPPKSCLCQCLWHHSGLISCLGIAAASWVFALLAGLGGDARGPQQRATLFTTVLMASLWISQPAHMTVVSLFPVVLFPLLGVAPSGDVASKYFSNTVFLLMGTCLLAIALEQCNGHKRVALRLLSSISSDPRVVLGGFMSVSALISMLLSNTATAAMMIPAATAIYDEVTEAHKSSKSTGPGAPGATTIGNATLRLPVGVEEEPLSPSSYNSQGVDLRDNFAPGGGTNGAEPDGKPGEAPVVPTAQSLRGYFCRIALGVAYSCSIGGLASKTGTGPNIVFSSQYKVLVGGSVDYGRWLVLGVPVSLLLLAACWALLVFGFGGLGLPPGYMVPTAVLRDNYAKMGRATRSQKVVACAFAATVLGWLLRAPDWLPRGWASLMPGGDMISDATVVMAVAVLLFFVPCEGGERDAAAATILDWRRIGAQVPFDILILVGAGGAISHAFKVSGLTQSIGASLQGLRGVHTFFIVLLINSVAACLSQITSDAATATILLPIAKSIADSTQVDPLVVMMCLTLSCSLPFLLPVSTPPNAIALRSGFVEPRDFIQFGFFPLVAGLAIIQLCAFSFGLRALGATGV